ncbi:hypothetical protein HU200_028176 [Digitaria exilis]|uniref:Phytocyanin domain-containing protein n=1 Tax=Digitaria exilis TaxID=1010633 RepID=A0A835EW59_9POAL|nr:hypothetical protein HU200_028176 [Digitaria exilis]
MARRQALLLAVVTAAACLAPLASAMEWMVGDDAGWRPQFNKTGWTNGKTFRVGKDDFISCNLQGNQLGAWTSGNDVVHLDKPGKVWFFCSVAGHCDNGMKLVVDVQLDAAPSPDSPPPPAPKSSAPAATTGRYTAAVAVATAVVASALAL